MLKPWFSKLLSKWIRFPIKDKIIDNESLKDGHIIQNYRQIVHYAALGLLLPQKVLGNKGKRIEYAFFF